MISAKEARTLVEQSEVLLEKYLDDLSTAITMLAQLGKTSFVPECEYSVPLQFRSIWTAKRVDYRATEFTPQQKLLQAKLKAEGYSMLFEKREVQIGGGLGSMDDEVRHEMQDYIKISW
jgi:hypothetical protein